MCGDFANNIPTSIFTIIDYSYPVTKSQGHGYTLKMGLLAKDSLNMSGKMRTSFHAVQYAINALNENWGDSKRADFKVEQYTDSINSADIYCYQLRQSKTNKNMLIVWLGNQVPGNSLQKSQIRLAVNNVNFQKPVMIDLLNGKVFSINNKYWEVTGNSNIAINIPVYDSPVIITEESEVRM